jgi:hypothetical protein
MFLIIIAAISAYMMIGVLTSLTVLGNILKEQQTLQTELPMHFSEIEFSEHKRKSRDLRRQSEQTGWIIFIWPVILVGSVIHIAKKWR